MFHTTCRDTISSTCPGCTSAETSSLGRVQTTCRDLISLKCPGRLPRPYLSDLSKQSAEIPSTRHVHTTRRDSINPTSPDNPPKPHLSDMSRKSADILSLWRIPTTSQIQFLRHVEKVITRFLSNTYGTCHCFKAIRWHARQQGWTFSTCSTFSMCYPYITAYFDYY